MALRFLTFDMKTFQPTSEIPEVSEPSWTFEVNEAETITLTVPIATSQSALLVDPTLYDMPRCGLAIEDNGVLVAAGPLILRQYDFRQGTMTLTAKGIFEIMKRRVSFEDHKYDVPTSNNSPFPADNGFGWDQNAIIVYNMNRMQQTQGGYLNIDVSGVTSVGVKREYQVWAYNCKTYYEIMQDRANIIGGFDFRFFPRWKNSARNSEIEWALEIFYPPSGRVTNLVYQLGSNCDFESATVDGSQIAFKAYSIGEGTGNTNLVASSTNSQYVAADYLLETVDREHTDATLLATVSQYAQQARKRRMKQSNIPAIIIPFNQTNDFVIGDQCRVLADYGLYKVDEMCRIMKATANPKVGITKIEVSPLALNGN